MYGYWARIIKVHSKTFWKIGCDKTNVSIIFVGDNFGESIYKF